MPTLAAMPTQIQPARPARGTRYAIAADEPAPVAAFVFDLDALFDPIRLDRAIARSAARRSAAETGLDPLWSEVLALELVAERGLDEALTMLTTLGGVRSAELEPPPILTSDAITAGIGDGEEAREMLGRLRKRFKLALVSTRPPAASRRIVRALELESLFDACLLDDVAGSCDRVATELGESDDTCVWLVRSGSKAFSAAANAGMRTVALHDLALVEALADGADAKYDDIAPPRVTH